ncbi:MAG: S41 family peptidase [Alphaproteobacteria bacterium]
MIRSTPHTPTILGRAASVLAMALWLAACSATPPAGPYGDSLTLKMIATGYGHVADKYLESVSLAPLALAGLNGLREIEPALEFDARTGWVRARHLGAEIDRVATPDAGDAEGWADVTVRLLAAARTASPALGQADNDRIFDAVFAGALATLDGPSKYVGPSKAEQNRAARNGFGGIGITIRTADADEPPGLVLVDVMADAPAERAGLWPGDRILTIDGASTMEMTLGEAVDRLRGAPGTAIALNVVRDGEVAREVALVREHVIAPTVTYARDGTLARIVVSRFNQGTARGVITALEKANRDIGDALSGIVLDLRGNPGGLLDQAITVADLFLADGLISTTRGRHHGSNQTFRASGTDFADGLPLAVLINGRSASATEVLAAALRDHGRGVLIGTVTYGKGTVQTVLAMPNDGELTLTWSRLFGPAGRTMNHFGLLPAICTSTGPGKKGDLAKALRAGIEGLNTARRLRAVEAVATGSARAARRERYRKICPPRETLAEAEDILAHELLTNPRLYARAQARSEAAVAQTPPEEGRRP